MQSKEYKDIVFIRLFPDEDINEKLVEACRLHNVKTAVVVSAVGQLKKAKIGYFKTKGDYTPEKFEKPFEILSLTGSICLQEREYLLHLHIVLGDEDKKTFGGHFIQGTVGVTAEIVLLKADINIQRKIDVSTGLKTLVLK